MRIVFTSLIVDDQEKALMFYTQVLGFQKKVDVPAGKFRWLTVVSPEQPDGVELVLEPNENPVARTYQDALFKSGIPLTSFAVGDVQHEYDRLARLGVVFSTKPTTSEWGTGAIFEDTCGNLIMLMQY